jgi:dimethylargininase
VPLFAIVRGVPGSFARALSAVPPDPPIDVTRARRQHAAYVAALRRLGARIAPVAHDDALPDCVFVEDTAVVAGGVALVTRPGAESRRDEPRAVRRVLAELVPVETMEAPATLDGGDCLRLGRRLYVGRSDRTNAEGVARAREVFGPRGVEVVEVPVTDTLHLKSVCSSLGENTVVVAEGMLPPDTFAGAREIVVPAAEAHAANLVAHRGHAIVAAGAPWTARLIEALGVRVDVVDTSELAKADGALTCLSILVEVR